MKLKLSISMLAVFFIWGMSLLYAFDPVDSDHDENEEGGGGPYVPENCSSSTNCMMHYTTLTKTDGRVYCCSDNQVDKQGKAKI